MIGKGFWSTGITVDCRDGKWSAHLVFEDDGWVGDDNPDASQIVTGGRLATRYAVADGSQCPALAAVIDAIKADAERIGITWRTELDGPHIYADFEAAGQNYPDRYPADWRRLLDDQARRVGWKPMYEQNRAA